MIWLRLVPCNLESSKINDSQSLLAAWGRDQPGVILKVADEVGQQRFVEVLDAFAACGIDTVGFVE